MINRAKTDQVNRNSQNKKDDRFEIEIDDEVIAFQ